MRRLFVLGLACAVLALLANRAAAWNSIGHLAVGKLAYDQLEDSQKIALFTLLKSHPHYERFLAAGRPPEINEVEWVILRAGLWPDWIRPRDRMGEKDPRGPEVTKYHRGEEHYINVPFIDPRDAGAFAGKTLVSPDSTNILCALKQRCNDLRTRTASAEDRAIAICWIFHLIGDIHQPLHNVAYFSDTPAFRQGDLGGNKFGVRVNGRKVKLHLYWDELLGEDPNYLDDSNERQVRIFQKALAVAESLRGLPLADVEQEKLKMHRTFESWSQEGFELARSVAYQKSDGSGLLDRVEVKLNLPIPEDAPEAGAKYAETARAIAGVRVVLAGQRLAERLKELLAK